MSSKTPANPKPSRDDRLKSALKANMARRKAQAKARATDQSDTKKGAPEGKDRP
ncbi:hypothetical protein N4R57_03110 [Rhodobacteraceae bacterium D3-12]|nr:hypothetical protein N4R57_03110 [Rhodobacteraceae bacterium D3-12]